MNIIDRIGRLVGTPSVSAVLPELDLPNRPVIDLLAGWLTDEGFECEVLPVTPDGQKANLIATRGRGPGGLVLSGHSDTVPFDAHPAMVNAGIDRAPRFKSRGGCSNHSSARVRCP